jgi:hypothetical protein
MAKQKTKKTVKRIVVLLLIVLVIAPLVKAELNYSHNEQIAQNFLVVNEQGYIQNQTATSVFRYGFNTSDNSGCGWIATYNALQFLYNAGKYPIAPEMEEVIKPLDRFGTFGFGFLGTNPLAVSLLLKTKGLKTSIVLKQEQFYEKAKEADINIMVYVSKKFNYGHYQMMQYNEPTDNFTFYTPGSIKTMDQFTLQHEDDHLILITIKA